MNRRCIAMLAVITGLATGSLACNMPTPTPHTSPGPLPQETTSLPSPDVPVEATATSTYVPLLTPETAAPSASPAASETALPPTDTPLPTETPTATPPVSTGPLDFDTPWRLDSWQDLGQGKYECRLVLKITGGAPPYTVHHDLDEFETWQTEPALVFDAHGCGALVHTIKVESADGQSVVHDYFISAPWCEQ